MTIYKVDLFKQILLLYPIFLSNQLLTMDLFLSEP